MIRTYWKNGDYNAICDVCGFKFKASKLKTRWDGLKVCALDYEERHPLELARLFPNNSRPTWTAPEPIDVFVPVCTLVGKQAVAGKAMAGCAITGSNKGY